MKIEKLILVTLISLLFIGGCKKDKGEDATVSQYPAIALSFSVDNNTLQFDDIKYTNAAGNNYSVNKFQFYLSAFEFENSDGSIFRFNDVIYVDAKKNTSTNYTFSGLPYGNYKRLKFLIGVDSIHNIENGLPLTVENDNMVWPSSMGGGYHFIKLEGNFQDSTQTFGYAMHLGKNLNQVTVNLVKDYAITGQANLINLKMNINEWFVNPEIYDFNIDGNYSMTDSAAMAKLAKNGRDVFTLN